MGGKHVLARFHGCQCDSSFLEHQDNIQDALTKIIVEAGLQICKQAFYKFGTQEDQFGWSGDFVLAESHVYFHTYPDQDNSLFLDVFVCHHTQDNTHKALKVYEDLKELFKPSRIEREYILDR